MSSRGIEVYVPGSFSIEDKDGRGSILIGGKSRKQIRYSLDRAGVKTDTAASQMMRSASFIPNLQPQRLDFVIRDVGEVVPDSLRPYVTTEEILANAEALGFGRLPAETAFYLLGGLKTGDALFMHMDPIPDRDGDPCVFYVGRDGKGLWLFGETAHPEDLWGRDARIVLSAASTPSTK